MRGSAIDQLRAAFDEPFAALGRDAAVDRGTVLVSWPSVPVELIRAAGFAPVFARGSGLATPAADRVLERDLFPNRLRQLVEAALAGRLARVAAILIPRSSDPDYKCFLYLRELVRRGVAPAMPPVLLFDLLHSDSVDARAYNAGRALALSAELVKIAGRRLEPDDVSGAIESANRARAAARRLSALRGQEPRVRGVDALPLLGAFWQLPPERYAALANAVADAAAQEAPLAGPRVLLAGAPVDSAALHAAIEADRAVVVAELSPFGGCGSCTDVEVSGDPLAQLARHYALESLDARVPGAQLLRRLEDSLGGVDAVIDSLPPDDATFGWDHPRIRALLARRSLPHAVLTGDPAVVATAADRARIDSLLRAAAARGEARYG